MKYTSLYSSFFALIALMLVGCDGSPYPLSEPGEAQVRTDILGVWTSVDPEQEYESTIEVFAFDKHQYLVRYTSTDPESETMYLRAYESAVGSERVTNVRCVSCDDESDDWLFFQVDTETGELALRLFADDAYDEFQSAKGPEEVKALFQAMSMAGDAWSDDVWVWRRR